MLVKLASPTRRERLSVRHIDLAQAECCTEMAMFVGYPTSAPGAGGHISYVGGDIDESGHAHPCFTVLGRPDTLSTLRSR